MADAKEPYRELYMAKSMEELNRKTSAKNMECSTPKLYACLALCIVDIVILVSFRIFISLCLSLLSHKHNHTRRYTHTHAPTCTLSSLVPRLSVLRAQYTYA